MATDTETTAEPSTTARPRWWLEILLLLGLYAVYSAIRNSVHDADAVAHRNGQAILDFQDHLGLSLERGLNTFLDASPTAAAVSALVYASLHFLVTPAVLVWLYLRHDRRYRFLSLIIILTTVVALIGFFITPTAPPRLLATEGFVDIMAKTGSWGWWPESGNPGSDAVSNQFAAMPSLHCAWATWCGIMLVSLARRTWLKVLGVLYPLVTFLVVMGTGNHYFLDVVAGIVALALGAGAVYGARAVRDARRVSAPPLSA
ncbi:phosphatase PAP2 family protein [Corynebacterium glyciniphilum]|uniref:phosphatase PAP2 family protein n=1 Tax=Corynebacterium glyciniphilum TaxID=1404244 RepID=UPI00264CB434|nr:phosphatase PAP2 family protein [Corynebacterium glyciniphilum]MDN5682240.1 phosphatase PAP2 family protein [Corynebacterium glyciniphilum]MDN6705498.1 phosphatase PAP2 family protein [Corynebacterium glyciniphilum]